MPIDKTASPKRAPKISGLWAIRGDAPPPIPAAIEFSEDKQGRILIKTLPSLAVFGFDFQHRAVSIDWRAKTYRIETAIGVAIYEIIATDYSNKRRVARLVSAKIN